MPDHHSHVGDRDSLFDELDNYVERHRSSNDCFAILMIQLRDYRRLNVRHGFKTAERVVKNLGQNLAQLKRPQDYLARVGNADFALLIPQIMNEGHASLAAIKIIEQCKQPLELEDKKFPVPVDIGIAVYPQHAEDSETLFGKSELALDDAGKNPESYAIYPDEDITITTFNWDIEAGLQQAIDKDQFELYFQPQVRPRDGRLFGAEALIRWKSGDKGFIRPDIFIPIAENSGQIFDITRWTLNAALWFRKSWPRAMDSANIAVNISTRVLVEPNFIDIVTAAVKLYAVDYSQLTLEITESALVDDISSTFATLDDLRSLGINISIDDFGTGYSSMAYFRNIPANELKVDKTFVCKMLDNPADRHIVTTIIQMARGFDLVTVAEGVEDQQTLDALAELQCDVAQGYHLAHPMPRENFIGWIDWHLGGKRDKAAHVPS